MGQYHLTVNLDKQEFLDPHVLGTGLKLVEQVSNPKPGLTAALHVLLACSNGRGGGDFTSSPLIGHWAGDRIAVVGDYAEAADLPGWDASAIYEECRTSYRYNEIEWTTAGQVEADEMFYLQRQWDDGMWRLHGRDRHSTDIFAQNLKTFQTRPFAASTRVALFGMACAEWTDLSWSMARFLQVQLDGQFTGNGWRHWQPNRPDLTAAL